MSRLPIDITAKYKPNRETPALLKMLVFAAGWAIIGGALAYGALTALESLVN